MHCCFFAYYRPQTKFAKVMFLHLSVSHSVHKGGAYVAVGGMRGQGGSMHGRGVWMAGGVHGRGMCMAGGMYGRGGMHGWGGMHGRGACVVRGHVWWQGGHVWQRGHAWWQEGMHGMHSPPQTLRDMVSQCMGSTHPTGMHFCFTVVSTSNCRVHLRFKTKSVNVFGNCLSLPTAREDNVFRSVCQSFCSLEGAGGHAWLGTSIATPTLHTVSKRSVSILLEC